MAREKLVPRFLRASLQRRLVLLVVLGMVVLVVVLGVSSLLAARTSVRRALEERQATARVSAAYLEYVLRQNLRYLEEASFAAGVDLEDGNPEPERQALHQAYLRSIFSDGVYLTDARGVVQWIEPYRRDQLGVSLAEYPHIQGALARSRPVVSDVFVAERTGHAAVAIVTPVRNSLGQLVGLVGGDIDVTRPDLQDIILPAGLGETGYVEVVDSQGTVLAGTDPRQLLRKSDQADRIVPLIQERKVSVGTWPSETSGAAEVAAFAPLPTISWGITIRQREDETLALARRLQERLAVLSAFMLIVGVLVAWGTARSVAGPVRALTHAARRITSGDLTQGIPVQGEDEIGELGRSLEAMRSRLKDSLEQVQAWNRELEVRVAQRTEELERRHQELSRLYDVLHHHEAARRELLAKLIAAQEAERKRIARELHDETSQSLAALVMALDMVLASGDHAAGAGKLATMKDMAVRTLDGVHQIIFDLRPSLLDDLGLLPALRWYAEGRLTPLGTKVRFEASGPERRLPSETEVALFRVVQEAVSNIVKHAEAENVVISLESTESRLCIEVEDDGRGFDVQSVGSEPGQVRGLGLLGMQERVELIGGRFTVESHPGNGTRIAIEVSLSREAARD